MRPALPPPRPRILLTDTNTLVFSTVAHGVVALGAWQLFNYIGRLRGDPSAITFAVWFAVAMGCCWMWSLVPLVRRAVRRWQHRQRLGKDSP